ncbi:hypothetical protein DFQ26_007141 [Actinomortierella ambigua]|nr:hypothetical protein DFQ26_007141 [Actinomortierella ambigua]
MKQDTGSPSTATADVDVDVDVTPVATSTEGTTDAQDTSAQVSFIKVLTKDTFLDSMPGDTTVGNPDWFSTHHAHEAVSDVDSNKNNDNDSTLVPSSILTNYHHPLHPLQPSPSLSPAAPAPAPNAAHATTAFGGYARAEELQHPNSLNHASNQLYRQGRGSSDSNTSSGPGSFASLLGSGSHLTTTAAATPSTTTTTTTAAAAAATTTGGMNRLQTSSSTSSTSSLDRELYFSQNSIHPLSAGSISPSAITTPAPPYHQQDEFQQQQQKQQDKDKDVIVEPPPKKVISDATLVTADHFEPDRHFYPRVLNAQIHPMVGYFFSLGNERIIARYMHLNPQVNEAMLRKCLEYRPKHFQWAGSDLFNVTTADGHRQMIIVETNSCPSGQKSMPLLTESDEHGGYRTVLDSAFKDMIERADRSLGDLAVVYDKNTMEASGYASTLADVMKEKVWSVEYYEDDLDPPVKWVDRVMHIRDSDKEWHPIRACFRYVTQKPWNRFPIHTRTVVMNQTVACLAGGRNKMMAAKAYEFFNAELVNSGLHVRVPETINNVTKSEIPLWLDSMGGHAVVKVPYSNAGQGVYTITNKEELKEFMETPHHYDKFIVQSLVGNASWSSITRHGKFYHVGTIPNKKTNTFVSDLRMMVAGNKDGFRPICIYARRARKPLLRHLSDDPTITSWEMLGTNLSVKSPTGEWSTEAARLLLMDRKDFNQLGLGVDDMIDAYIQTVLSVIAIDKMCQRLVRTTDEGEHFDMELFKALNPDSVLWQEILI